jgi:hypothetical protein
MCRKPGQTIVEILLAYTFMGNLLGMRHILDRRFNLPVHLARFRPLDYLFYKGFGHITYYYPSSSFIDFIAC